MNSAPQSFPQPIIYRCFTKRIVIIDNIGTREKTEAIVSESGAVYEKGRLLKKSIFGFVIHGLLLSSDPSEVDLFTRTNHRMAIKIYYKSLLAKFQGQTEENPYREISAIQFIGDNHPNILGQVESCTDTDYVYSIMRYFDGSELLDVINDEGPMSEDKARHLFRQLLDALEHLQQFGIGHRDLSLENILYDGENVVVIDFGMCIRSPRSSSDDIDGFDEIPKQPTCGKLNYISPEVIAEVPQFNPMLCDIWASGIILFMVLTSSPPMEVASSQDRRYRMIADGQLRELLTIVGIQLSEEAMDLIQRILHPDPNQRLTIQQIREHPWLTRYNKHTIIRAQRDRCGSRDNRSKVMNRP